MGWEREQVDVAPQRPIDLIFTKVVLLSFCISFFILFYKNPVLICNNKLVYSLLRQGLFINY